MTSFIKSSVLVISILMVAVIVTGCSSPVTPSKVTVFQSMT